MYKIPWERDRNALNTCKESTEDTFSTAYRIYMTNHGAWQQRNGYSKAKLSAGTVQDTEHYTAVSPLAHINHTSCPGDSEWHGVSAH